MTNALLAALTEAQMDQVLQLVREIFHAIGEGFKAVWIALGPLLISYLVFRQAMNKKELLGEVRSGNEVSSAAHNAANNLNQKLETATVLAKEASEATKKVLEDREKNGS